MRRRIVKQIKGRGTKNRKEVLLRVNKSGLDASGNQKYVIAVRFTDESYKKASSTDYVAIEIDDELNRMYFVTADSKEGFKLTSSGNSSKFKAITFSVDSVDVWIDLIGEYDLLKDNDEHLYYIDFNKK